MIFNIKLIKAQIVTIIFDEGMTLEHQKINKINQKNMV